MAIPLAAVSIFWHIVIVVWLLVALSLILVVLIQKGRGGGLASAFGGAGASSLLGTKTGDFLTWLTIGLVAAFLILSVIMGLYMRPVQSEELFGPAAQTVPATQTTETPSPASSTGSKPAEATGSKEAAPQPAPQSEKPATPGPTTETPPQPGAADTPKK